MSFGLLTETDNTKKTRSGPPPLRLQTFYPSLKTAMPTVDEPYKALLRHLSLQEAEPVCTSLCQGTLFTGLTAKKGGRILVFPQTAPQNVTLWAALTHFARQQQLKIGTLQLITHATCHSMQAFEMEAFLINPKLLKAGQLLYTPPATGVVA
ncbi:MAG: hypothetical protein A3E85_00135 [Gammaproteobacteria bacterium RIFCSPHIGHO2_12_FULL_45_12]|nr:MAG: hypothetical protein A3E85_00135 [Gammaproteobacteria bacterium RIFCSPHIGHO2_12_FULL_45_12]